MVFSSLLFIFVFLPIQLLVYYLTPDKYKNAVLLLFSAIFYCWSGPGYIFILLFEAFVSFFMAKEIGKCGDGKDGMKLKKIFLGTEVVVLLSVLVFFKYLSFGAQCINSAFSVWGNIRIKVPEIALPIGISFYTFQLISYVVDVYRKKVKANESYFKVLLYAALFHQCIAGPIVRYETVNKEIDKRSVNLDDIYSGVLRFSIGLFKKAVLANSCAACADKLMPDTVSMIAVQPVLGLWIGAVFYMLQIYLDFSAYSDMAIGMGRMVGFHYLENFNYPYIAKSVTDFWRRWHISLSSFFRDYVYIPLGGNRVKPFRHIINLFIVWFLTGLWHGASVNFVLWGLYYFVFLVIEKYVVRLFNKSEKNKVLGIVGSIFGHIYALIIVLAGWVLFRCDSFDVLKATLYGMIGYNGNALWSQNVNTVLMENIYLLIVCFIAVTPLVRFIYRKMLSSEKKICTVIVNIAQIIVPVLLIILAAFALAGNSYNPFIYYRF